MPLLDGSGHDVIEHNIAELVAAGHPRDQAVAIAYDHARRQYRHDAARDIRRPAGTAGGHATALVHMVAMAQRHGTARKRRAMPRANYPHALEAAYGTAIVELVHKARAAYDPLVARLPALLERARESRGDADAERMDAGELDEAKRLVDAAGARMRGNIPIADVKRLASYFARETSQVQRRELARQLSSALGIEVLPDEKYIPELLDYFVHENATLIGSIPEELHQDVANLTARAFTKRMTPETYGQLLEDRFGVEERRARFIARDQLGKLWGQLNAVRQRGLGINEFVWQTRRDEKVRPSHRRLEGKVISYENPPDVGLPGEDFNCRCQARPVVDGILDAAKQLRDTYHPVDYRPL